MKQAPAPASVTKTMSWDDWVRALDLHMHSQVGQLMGGISPIQTYHTI